MRKRKDDETLSLFDVVEPKEITGPKVDVVRLDYVTAEPMTWQELFEGYQKLRAITFSSGIHFVYNLLDMFEDAEIIFGCESVMSYSMQEIMAYQNQLLERMRDAASNSRQKLLERIDNGSVRFYVAHNQLSHEKIYLLEAEDGRKRVVMGSANLSYNAFGGMQRENICCIDSEAAYEKLLRIFLR